MCTILAFVIWRKAPFEKCKHAKSLVRGTRHKYHHQVEHTAPVIEASSNGLLTCHPSGKLCTLLYLLGTSINNMNLHHSYPPENILEKIVLVKRVFQMLFIDDPTKCFIIRQVIRPRVTTRTKHNRAELAWVLRVPRNP